MENVKKSFISSIPVFMGYIVLGIAFGMLLVSKGYSWYYSLLMSVLIYAGSMQFVTINLLTSGASLISSALMTLFINARHFVYGISMLEKYRDSGKYKPYLIFSLTDETYSLLVTSNNDNYQYMFLVSLFNHCYWVLGSVIGGILGSFITINTKGLDFAMTALFIVIVVEQFLSTKKHVYSYIGFLMSILSLVIFGSTAFIIPSLVGILICLIGLYRKENTYE